MSAVDPTDETRSASKVDLAHRMIRERILDGTYGPGQRLILGSLANELGVSTVPVREAIRRLEAEELVSFTRSVGAAVRVLDLEEYGWALETLAIMEGAATGAAASLLSPDRLAEAHLLNERMRAGLADFDPDRHSRLNQAFHRVLSSSCPNPDLVDLVERGWTRMASLRSSVFAFVPERAEGSVIEHDTILAAIEGGAPASEVETLTRNHRMTTLQGIRDRYAAAD